MEIHLNITFPRVPCELLTLDVMDVSGEQQHGVQHGIKMTRLRPVSEGGGEIDSKSLALYASPAQINQCLINHTRAHLLIDHYTKARCRRGRYSSGPRLLRPLLRRKPTAQREEGRMLQHLRRGP